MRRYLTGLALIVASFLPVSLHAQSSYAPVTQYVACGELFNPACAKVLPRIAARTAQAGLDVKPVESGGALDTLAAVCRGQAAAAIVPRDAMAQMLRAPECLGRYDAVGRALYPLYAVLVTKADAPFRQLDDMTRDGRKATIAVGREGSGGQVTLGLLTGINPTGQQSITMTDDDFDTALQRIADGSIDGFFGLESMGGDLIDRVRMKTDANGKPLYRFIDVRPAQELSRLGDGTGHCLYRLTALDFGGATPVTTVSTDAVMVLSRTSRDVHARSGPRAADALASAIDASQAAILMDMKSPADWRSASTSCQ
jgi:hypothetical protein